MTKLIVVFRNFVYTPKNRSFLQRRSPCSAYECFPTATFHLRNDGLSFAGANVHY
jgi:hypothetical protein